MEKKFSDVVLTIFIGCCLLTVIHGGVAGFYEVFFGPLPNLLSITVITLGIMCIALCCCYIGISDEIEFSKRLDEEDYE